MDPFLTAEGVWQLALDPAPCQSDTPPAEFPLTMTLPGTTAQQQIGWLSSDLGADLASPHAEAHAGAGSGAACLPAP